MCLWLQEHTKGVDMGSVARTIDERVQVMGWVGSTLVDVALATFMFMVVLTSGYLSLTRHNVSVPQSARVVIASPGQNLWSLAEAHPVHGLDTAQTVALIRLLNSKVDSRLQSGEVVLVPVTTRIR